MGHQNVNSRQFQSIATKRGAESEQRVSVALDNLQEQGIILTHWAATQYDDHVLGIDHFIIDKAGDTHEIQIKSSFTGARNAEKEHPGVRVFITQAGETEDQIQQRLIDQLKLR